MVVQHLHRKNFRFRVRIHTILAVTSEIILPEERQLGWSSARLERGGEKFNHGPYLFLLVIRFFYFGNIFTRKDQQPDSRQADLQVAAPLCREHANTHDYSPQASTHTEKFQHKMDRTPSSNLFAIPFSASVNGPPRPCHDAGCAQTQTCPCIRGIQPPTKLMNA